MSIINGYFDGFYGGLPAVPVEVDTPRNEGKAPKPDRVPARNGLTGYVVTPGGILGLPGVSGYGGYSTGQSATGNYSCAWPWQRLWAAHWQTYEWMLCHPKIAHAFSQIVNSILASNWDVDVAEGTPEAHAQLVRDMFFPLRRRYVEGALLGLAFGCATAQVEWGNREGQNWIKQPHWLPVARGWGNIIVEKGTGRTLGIRWPDTDNKPIDYTGPEAFIYTHQRYRTSSPYGLSRLENLRTQAWQPWLETWGQLAKTLRKLSGMYVYAKVPAGSFVDQATGKEISFREDVKGGIQALANGDIGIVLTNLALESDDPDVQAKLAGASLVELSALDFGSVSSSVTGYLEALNHYEGLMSEGMLRTPRTAGGTQQKHSGRADTEQHTQTDLLDSQMLAGDIDAQINEQQVDAACLLNFGDAYKPGSVQLKTKPLQDDTKDRANTLLQMIFTAQGTLAPPLAQTLDIDKLIADAGYASVSKFEQAMQEQQQQEQEQAKQAAQAAAAAPPANNGNGKAQPGNGRMAGAGK